MSKDFSQTIVITGGGTGGHIYPGLAIAETLQKLDPQAKIVFVGAQGGMEEKIFPRYKYPFHLIKIGRLHSSVGRVQQIKTLLMMPFSLLHAAIIFMKVRPTSVLGVGGFASGPFLLISWLLGAKTYLWEANAYPGLTNRWLSRIARATFVVFEESQKYLKSKKIIFSGMPVRQEFFQALQKQPQEKFRLLVFGGSQGARFINFVVRDIFTKNPDLLNNIDLVHQIGSRDYKQMVDSYGAIMQRAQILEYIHDMPQQLQQADLVICRSGASTVAEVVSCRKPTIFIPLPTAADNHQFHNAQVIAQKGGAIVMEQKDVTAENVLKQIEELKTHSEKLQQMSEKLQEFDFSDASQRVAQSLLEGI
ncbi:MAG: undecaprenyldiphospho-muramoylpentapeptide beta-N-acetylglucosaminyltransferase [Bdellovibrionaceae bacterium]|nr:undecaprenyldiphospho-muramoylpentapeptide beta-N-acetylglucosaminyltransferase [Pseudobdellovibrionaceae bacterium]